MANSHCYPFTGSQLLPSIFTGCLEAGDRAVGMKDIRVRVELVGKSPSSGHPSKQEGHCDL